MPITDDASPYLYGPNPPKYPPRVLRKLREAALNELVKRQLRRIAVEKVGARIINAVIDESEERNDIQKI